MRILPIARVTALPVNIRVRPKPTPVKHLSVVTVTALPVNIRVRPKPTPVKHLSVAPFLGRIQALPADISCGWSMLQT